MSAIALDIEHLSPKTHRAYYEVLKEERGILWADILVGRLPGEENPFTEASASIDTSSCIKCKRHISEYEHELCIYQYDNGDPAFYLCPSCETEFVVEVFEGDADSTKKDSDNDC